MQFTTLNMLALAASASAATIKVTVGEKGLTYSPNDIKASVGDSVEFSFFPANHTVTQSSFADPCHPLAGGFFSGFVPTTSSPSGTTFTIAVKDTKPVWVYCGQPKGNHCQSGMVAAINAPATGNTLAAFTALAKNATTSTSPPSGPIGGELNTGSNSTSTGSNSASSVVYTSSFSTTAVVTTEVPEVYTSNGATYTTSSASTYTTAYVAVVTSATGSSSSSPAIVAASGAGSLTVSMAVLGAAMLGAMVLA